MKDDQPIKPANILNIVATNQGRRPLTMDTPISRPLSTEKVSEWIKEGYVIVDTRSSAEFGSGHIPGAYNVQLTSSEFEQRVGWVTPPDTLIILVTDDEQAAQRAIFNMAFIALDSRVVGHLDGGMSAWMNTGRPVAVVPQMDVHTLKRRLSINDLKVLDVRDDEEWDEGHIENAAYMNFKVMQANLDELPLARDQHIALVCASGMRSSTAGSILLMNGYKHIYNVTGGMNAWRAARLPMVDGTGATCVY